MFTCLLSPALNLAALPDLGSSAQQSLSSSEKITLKQAFIKALYSSHKVNTNPILNQWLTTLGQHLTQFSNLPDPPTFLLINDPSINAFAGPGGVIGIHSGLIMKAQTTGEVAAVIAHELGHLQQNHLLRRVQGGDRAQLTAFATLLAAILIGQHDPQAGIATLYAGNSINLQQQLAFSRTHETEADAVGIDILARTGFNPNAMASFFKKLARVSALEEATPEILRTHPTSTQRMAAAENRASKLKTAALQQPALPEADYLPYIQALLSQPPYTPAQTCFIQKLSFQNDLNCTLTLSGWLAHLSSPPQNIRTIRYLLDRYPQNVALHLRLGSELPQTEFIRRLKSLTNSPSPLNVLVLETLSAQLAKQAPEESKLYSAWAKLEQGYRQTAKRIIKTIDTANLSPRARLTLQALETQIKAQPGTPLPK